MDFGLRPHFFFRSSFIQRTENISVTYLEARMRKVWIIFKMKKKSNVKSETILSESEKVQILLLRDVMIKMQCNVRVEKMAFVFNLVVMGQKKDGCVCVCVCSSGCTYCLPSRWSNIQIEMPLMRDGAGRKLQLEF